MSSRLKYHINHFLLPCLAFSGLTGFLSAILITAFKLAVESVLLASSGVYDTVRQNPVWMPVLVLGAAALGYLASIILSVFRSCRGGGIPTSVAAIRGMVGFQWLTGILILPFTALITYFCGVPLGTEGPCVQMGTAIGEGVVRCFGKRKHNSWRRYAMTGGSAAGFSIATASPISAVIFSMEELHKRFSPMLLTVASVSVLTAQITMQLLAHFGIGSSKLFHISEITALSPKLLFAPILIGIMCGGCSILFTYFYHFIDKIVRRILSKISIKLLFPVLFAAVSLVGFGLADGLGSGHGLIDSLLDAKNVWYMLLLIFFVRMLFMMIANTSGVTGGIFLPTLAFGAILGSLCFRIMEAFGWIGEEHYVLMVVLGITAFLSATSRIPITACVFAIEALGGIHNVLPLIIATTAAILVAEASGVKDFTDSVIESKMHQITKGKTPHTLTIRLVIQPDSFIIGKAMNDILWPNDCTIVAFKHSRQNKDKEGIHAGDMIIVRYDTYEPEKTAAEIVDMVGPQAEETWQHMLTCEAHKEYNEAI